MDIEACVDKLQRDASFKGSATIKNKADWDAREWVDKRRKKPTWRELEAVSDAVDIETAEPDTARKDKIETEMRDIAEKALIERGEIEARRR